MKVLTSFISRLLQTYISGMIACSMCSTSPIAEIMLGAKTTQGRHGSQLQLLPWQYKISQQCQRHLCMKQVSDFLRQDICWDGCLLFRIMDCYTSNDRNLFSLPAWFMQLNCWQMYGEACSSNALEASYLWTCQLCDYGWFGHHSLTSEHACNTIKILLILDGRRRKILNILYTCQDKMCLFPIRVHL